MTPKFLRLKNNIYLTVQFQEHAIKTDESCRTLSEYDILGEHDVLVELLRFTARKLVSIGLYYSMDMIRKPDSWALVNLGTYDKQYEYANAEFCEFDRFLFEEWN